MHASVALVTLLALLMFMWTTVRVGMARKKFGVAAPATTGHPDFERHFRVQANTVEGLIVFLPALWLFAIFSQRDFLAAAIGLVWIVGRIVYALGYAKAPEQREIGFMIQALAQVVLLLGALGLVIWQGVMKGF
jgi:glutathione S-transferase